MPRLPFVYPLPGHKRKNAPAVAATRGIHVHTHARDAGLPRRRDSHVTGVTSLEDSHLPNCVPVYLFCAGTYLDYAMHACATAREQRIGPNSILSTDDRDRAVYSKPAARTPHATIKRTMCDVVSVNWTVEILARDIH